MISGLQIRLGRAALGWGVRDLAAAASIAPSTVVRLEAGGGAQTRTIIRIQSVFEVEGLKFIPADERGGEGVRLAEAWNNAGRG